MTAQEYIGAVIDLHNKMLSDDPDLRKEDWFQLRISLRDFLNSVEYRLEHLEDAAP